MRKGLPSRRTARWGRACVSQREGPSRSLPAHGSYRRKHRPLTKVTRPRGSIACCDVCAGVLTLLLLAPTAEAAAQNESWIKPIAIGGVTSAVGGAVVGWVACGTSDNDPASCAAAGAVYLLPPGLITGTVLRATRTSGWRAAWLGGLTGLATGLAAGGVAAIVGGGDEKLDYLLIGAAAYGGAGLLAGTVVGHTTRYAQVRVSAQPLQRSLRFRVSLTH